MEIKYVTFDIADQEVKCWDAYAWHNFIADTRQMLETEVDYGLEELFDYAYGDEFWFEEAPRDKTIYAIGFDLRSEEFIFAGSERDVEFYNEMAIDSGDEDEVFWA